MKQISDLDTLRLWITQTISPNITTDLLEEINLNTNNIDDPEYQVLITINTIIKYLATILLLDNNTNPFNY